MNWDRVEGKWKQTKGKFREKWGKLTDDDLDVVGGKREQVVGRLQERYGIAKDEAERQADTFVKGLSKQDREDEDKEVRREKAAGHRFARAACVGNNFSHRPRGFLVSPEALFLRNCC